MVYCSFLNPLLFVSQDKEIYRWPIKESIKAMLAWEWTLEKARDGEGEVEKKAAPRKISQTAQVHERERSEKHSILWDNVLMLCCLFEQGWFLHKGATLIHTILC